MPLFCSLPFLDLGKGFHSVGIAQLGCDGQRGGAIQSRGGVEICPGVDQDLRAIGI
ncbi:hypothetical protein [Endozoicomonas sp. SESOKO3]|nr:hypothetical protein [Endozoicomonas sp. SESOKO3]